MINTTIAHYTITAKLGQGGMGAVYRATDTKLDREVAIKVLPEAFAQHPERLARFEREAKALAKLNHPNIGSIYGFDQHEGLWFLVLELIEGDDLSERLKRGPLPVAEALKVFQQIAEALKAAHDKGIVHRDLKPGNVKIDPSGRVKVLDFGLAKARFGSSEAVDSNISTAPAITSEFTMPGRVMGTAAYMSPEQSRGQEVDKRTDVWAFGCCLYEALTGRRPFKGATTSDLLAEILKSDPDFTVIPGETPGEVATLLRRCLEKEPRRRLRDLGDIALTLEETSSSSHTGVYSAPAPTTAIDTATQSGPVHRTWAWPVAAALSAALLVAGFLLWRGPAAPATLDRIRSLAVLPFRITKGDPELEGLARGIQNEIFAQLRSLPGIEMANQPSLIDSLRAAGKVELEIAQALAVDGVVIGDVSRQGNDLSVLVSLVNRSTGREEVGDTIKRPFEELSNLPRDAALALVDKLRLSIDSRAQKLIQTPGTSNSDAFVTFHNGKDLLNERRLVEAEVELRRAYRLDTNYTEAWASLAFCQVVSLVYGGTTREMRTTYEQLATEVERFRARHPADPAVATTEMWIAIVYERDWERARRVFWESQQNHKPDADLWLVMSWYYTYIEGHRDLALHAMGQCIGLDPENVFFQSDQGSQLRALGEFKEAASVVRNIPVERLGTQDHSDILLMAGDLTGARQATTRALERSPNARNLCNLAAIHAKSGAADEARKILAELESQAEQGMHIPYAQIAWSYGMLGDFESARRWLREGLTEGRGDWSMLSLRSAEKLEVFGREPWYWDIVDGMKFPPLQMDNRYFALEQEMRYHRTDASGSTGTDRSSAPSTKLDRKRIVLVPFEPLGNKDEDKTLAEFLTATVQHQLGNVKELNVLDGSYLDSQSNADPASNYRRLNAGTILTGKVHQIGGQFVLIWQLRDSQSPEISLASGEGGASTEEVLFGRGTIAQSVAQALKVELLPSELELPTDSEEAYKFYMEGRAFWLRRTIDDFKQAIDSFDKAIQSDTNFAQAYAGLANCHLLMPLYDRKEVRKHHTESVRLAKKAIDLDPTIAEPHATVGFGKFIYERDWSGAEKHLRVAQLLDPDFSHAFRWHGEALLSQGRLDEALKMAIQVVDMEDTPINHTLYPQVLANQGNFKQAIEYIEGRIKEEPSFILHYYHLARAHALNGDFSKALADIEHVGSKMQFHDVALKLWILALMGETGEARQQLQKLEEQASSAGREEFIALVLHALGEDEKALDWLETAVEKGSILNDFLSYRVAWKKLHNHPRYQAILRKLNLPD